MDINAMSASELREVRDSINARLRAIREQEKAEREREASGRESEFKGNLNEGDVVRFLFGSGTKREVLTGTIKRVSEKTVTLPHPNDADKSLYRKYSDIVEVVSEAEVSDEADAA